MAADAVFAVAGIGASAGGVEALKSFFRAMPVDLGIGLVVVTHLGPHHESALPSILGECTGLPVVRAENGQTVEPDHVYVLPTDGILTIAEGRLLLRPQVEGAERERRPIDIFLASLAIDQGTSAIGIVLSGSGSDGTLGLKAIKEHGGLTIAQGTDGSGPAFPEMPRSAAAGGFVDIVVPVEEMPARIADFIRAPAGTAVARDDAAAQKTICDILRRQVGHDFSGYKDKTFFRRVKRRTDLLRLDGLEAYIALLDSSAEEAGHLFRDLLIGVTGFFRDADAFTALETMVIAPLLEGREAEDTVRVWVPGCSTGEEAYSIAILLLERVAGRRDAPRVQVFASDIDDSALAVARSGRYPASLLSAVSPERLKRYFQGDGTSHTVAKELRETCIFSTHSVVRDPPFSRMDLVSCRNLLIYLGGALQEKVIPVFHYALKPGGFLFLGLSETIARHGDLFAAVDKGNRIFRRREHAPVADLSSLMRPGTGRAWQPAVPTRPPTGGSGADLRAAAAALVLEQFAPAHVVVNRDGDVLHQSARLGKYLEPVAGAPSRQLLALARRGLRTALRAALRQVAATGKRVVCPRVEIEVEDRVQAVAVTLTPMPGRDPADPLILVVFADLGPPVMPGEPAAPADAGTEHATSQLELELRELRERLQTTIEEYETTAEELKSANEEMVSVNEELQSTNEELETAKEEQQSVNEELRTVNLELAGKLEELDRANADLRNLFESTRIATLFLDRRMIIRNFTPAVSAIVNLQPSDRGRPLTDFSHKLEAVDLPHEVSVVLTQQTAIERRVATRDNGPHYLMRLLPYRTAEGALEGVVLTFIDVSGVVEAEILGTMVAELNHRVRNMLQVVLAVSQRTQLHAASLEEFGVTFRGRILALARAHELIAVSGWTQIPLRELLLKETEPYGEGRDRFQLDGAAVGLTPRIALALGMVLHELATNASKYGSLSVPGGRVTIGWTVTAGAAPELRVRWVESGGPPVVPPKRRGFGSELIERQVRHDLHGTYAAVFAPAGLRVELAFGLSAAPGRQAVAPQVTALLDRSP